MLLVTEKIPMRDGLLGRVGSLTNYIRYDGPFIFSFSREGLREGGNTLTITTARARSAFDGEEGEFVLVWDKVQ